MSKNLQTEQHYIYVFLVLCCTRKTVFFLVQTHKSPPIKGTIFLFLSLKAEIKHWVLKLLLLFCGHGTHFSILASKN